MSIRTLMALLLAGSVVNAVELAVSTDYRVVHLNGHAVDQVEGLTAPTLFLDPKEQRASGTSGINRYGGAYTMAGGVLTVQQPFSTMMAGPEAAMQVERDFLAIITSPMTIRADSQGLVLTSATGTLLITPAKK